MSNLPERLLARLTTSDRAAAIFGDLTEMAATRSRLWFFAAYLRTLVSLGWRTPVALICAIGTRYLFGVVIWRAALWLNNLHRSHARTYAQVHHPLSGFNWLLCRLMVEALVFALPFVLLRFGLRNRLTQLTCALLLFTLPINFLFGLSPNPFMFHLFIIFSVVAISVALLLPLWRGPMIVLAATCIPVVVMSPFFLMWCAWTVGIREIPHAVATWPSRHLAIFFIYQMTFFALAAIVCLYLSNRMLRQRPAIA